MSKKNSRKKSLGGKTLGKAKYTHKIRHTKKNKNIINKKKTRKGGMFRYPKGKLPVGAVSSVEDILETAYAQPYDPTFRVNTPSAEAHYTPFAEVDTATDEQKLAEIYDDIAQNGFRNVVYAEQLDKVLKAFPDFDVTIMTPDNKTLLDDAFDHTRKSIANKLINSPKMTIESLRHSLDYINNYNGQLNRTQQIIKTMIEEMIDNKELITSPKGGRKGGKKTKSKKFNI